MTDAGFTREELAEAAAKQAHPAPTKAEILEAIGDIDPGKHDDFWAGRGAALAAVERLFEERGL